jgi:hypothetical protein
VVVLVAEDQTIFQVAVVLLVKAMQVVLVLTQVLEVAAHRK